MKANIEDDKLYLTCDNMYTGFMLDKDSLSEETLMNIVNWCMKMFEEKTKTCKNCKI